MTANHHKILLVEDSKFFSTLVKKEVERETGVAVDCAGTLAEARRLITVHPNLYTLALVDIMLPDSSDSEVIEMCRDSGIPSVVYSSLYAEDFRERMMSLSVIDYIVKDNPASLQMLIGVTHRILNNRKTIALVVDDSRTARNYISDLLKHYQFQTLTACNGKEALETIKNTPGIRLVVTDFHMPEMDGIELIRTIRATHPRDRLAIIGLSSGGGSSTAALFIKHGANDFITKPFLREEFFFRVNQNMDMLDLIEAFKDSANRDHLTELHNRRYLTEVGDKLYASQKRGKITLAVGAIDLDHFKSINDTHGHDAGDQVLIEVGRILTAATRESDVVVRLGGEEFCVLTMNLGHEGAAHFFERIRVAVETTEIKVGDKSIRLTASLGVCLCPCRSLQEMLAAADSALYRAKAAGRNRIEYHR